jgi:hypothetical protein
MQITAIETEDGRKFTRMYQQMLPDSWVTGQGPQLYVIAVGTHYLLEKVVEIAQYYTNVLYIRVAGSSWYRVEVEDLFYELEG